MVWKERKKVLHQSKKIFFLVGWAGFTDLLAPWRCSPRRKRRPWPSLDAPWHYPGEFFSTRIANRPHSLTAIPAGSPISSVCVHNVKSRHSLHIVLCNNTIGNRIDDSYCIPFLWARRPALVCWTIRFLLDGSVSPIVPFPSPEGIPVPDPSFRVQPGAQFSAGSLSTVPDVEYSIKSILIILILIVVSYYHSLYSLFEGWALFPALSVDPFLRKDVSSISLHNNRG